MESKDKLSLIIEKIYSIENIKFEILDIIQSLSTKESLSLFPTIDCFDRYYLNLRNFSNG